MVVSGTFFRVVVSVISLAQKKKNTKTCWLAHDQNIRVKKSHPNTHSIIERGIANQQLWQRICWITLSCRVNFRVLLLMR